MDWLAPVATIVQIAAGLAGVVGLWFGIDNRRTLERERLERESERANRESSVRLLVRLDLEHNQAVLWTFWKNTVLVLPVGTPIEQQFQQRRLVIDTPMPSWQRTTWNSLTPELAQAFEENLLRDIRTLYSQLDSLSELVERIKSFMPTHLAYDYDDYCAHTPLNERSIENASVYEPMQRFVRDTQPLWSHIIDLHGQLDFGTVISRLAR